MIDLKTLVIALGLGAMKLEFSILFLYHSGASPFLTFLIAFSLSSLVTVFWYYFADLVRFLLESFAALATGEKKNSWIDKIWLEKVKKPVEQRKKVVIKWLLDHNRAVLFLIMAVPFTFLITDIAIMAVRIGRIKKGLILIISANACKILAVLTLFYRIF
jgi:undecaprenyl pyrophosphate phosphatase UppP